MPAASLFDAYLMVDWSAAAVPTCGKDSIWLCHLRREAAGLRVAALENPATRHAARTRLLELLRAERAAGAATLAGFDFAFGYPQGLAARLSLAGPPWRAIWDFVADRLADAPDNRNNRFAVAAEMNRLISGGPAPFWGCPSQEAGPCLAAHHHRRHDALGLAERRLADSAICGPQPVWKLAYPGAVGSQILTGLPVLRWLRDHADLAEAVRVWPFETGLRPLARAEMAGRIVLAEIYPSLVLPAPHAVKDAGQVIAIARHFAEADEHGALGPLFAGPPALDAASRRRVEREESWILGVTTASRHAAQPRQRPAAE